MSATTRLLVTQEWLDDNAAFIADVERYMVQELSKALEPEILASLKLAEDEIMNGDGSGEPIGIIRGVPKKKWKK